MIAADEDTSEKRWFRSEARTGFRPSTSAEFLFSSVAPFLPRVLPPLCRGLPRSMADNLARAPARPLPASGHWSENLQFRKIKFLCHKR